MIKDKRYNMDYSNLIVLNLILLSILLIIIIIGILTKLCYTFMICINTDEHGECTCCGKYFMDVNDKV